MGFGRPMALVVGMAGLLVYPAWAATLKHQHLNRQSDEPPVANSAASSSAATPAANSGSSSVATPAASSGASSKSSPLTAVITTLQDILLSVGELGKKETVIFDEYSKWCVVEQKKLKEDLEESKTQLADGKVEAIEQLTSTEESGLYIKKCKRQIDDIEDAIAQAVALRTDELQKYTEEKELNAQTLHQLGAAIKHVTKVSKQGGFLQNGVMTKYQINQPGESSYVMGVLGGLEKQLQSTKDKLQDAEEGRVKMHDSFMKTKGAMLKSLTDARQAKMIANGELQVKQTRQKNKIRKLTELVLQLEVQIVDTGDGCVTTANDWKLRQSDRIKETGALDQAIRFLKSTSLEQLPEVEHDSPDDDVSQEEQVFGASFLQVAAATISESERSAATRAQQESETIEAYIRGDGDRRKEPVQRAIKKLIISHEDTVEEDATKNKYCEKALEASAEEKAATTLKLGAVTADIAKKSNEFDVMIDEMQKLGASIVTTRNNLESAGKVRKKETALFVSSSKDRTLAVKVLKQAKTVLQSFYDKDKDGMFNLLQESPTNPQTKVNPTKSESTYVKKKPQFQHSARKSSASFGAVQMIGNIGDDIEQEQRDAVRSEMESVKAYEVLQQESQESIDETQAGITERTVAKSKLKVQTNYLKEDENKFKDDLQSVIQEIKGLHSECDELIANLENRRKGALFEMDQLRDVADILRGAKIAERTSLGR